MANAYFIEQELSPVGHDGEVDLLAPTTTLTAMVDSSSGTHRLVIKMVDGDGNTKTFVVSEDEVLALCKGLQRASFYLHYTQEPAALAT